MERVDLFAESADDPAPAAIDVSDRKDATDVETQKDTVTKFAALNDLLVGPLGKVAFLAQPTGDVELYFDTKKLRELWIAVTWSA